MEAREFDVALHGASGFVGRLTARELAAHGHGARIALSGRSEQRLEAVRRELGVDWPSIVTDSADPASVRALAERANVVASAVGPYGRYGLPLVLACAAAGTSYADLTGETLFAHDSIRLADADARRTGARIVHSAGFDSVPSDLGVLLLRERAAADGEGELATTVLVLMTARGGFSGGTIDSARAEIERLQREPRLGALLADPYALSPDRAADPSGTGEADAKRAAYDPFLGRWVAPFVMGPGNARVVRRSAALAGGIGALRYREAVAAGRGATAPVVAQALALGQGALLAGLQRRGTRLLLDRLLPKPGSGPSERSRLSGSFAVRIHAETTTGARYLADVATDRDPGYGATAVMFGQSALCLALDGLDTPGGVTTPAVAMGDALVRRLRERGFMLRVRRARIRPTERATGASLRS